MHKYVTPNLDDPKYFHNILIYMMQIEQNDFFES